MYYEVDPSLNLLPLSDEDNISIKIARLLFIWSILSRRTYFAWLFQSSIYSYYSDTGAPIGYP